ncbi:MAG TPA: M48 family metallopeptidase, partial [Pyrinomonadaceae bacterium]|nr:M48 family metallopeptidase [Pyrinomonadaceae bacterium]
FSRVATALTLALSLWSGAIATAAAPAQQQQQTTQAAAQQTQQPTQQQTTDEPPVMPQPRSSQQQTQQQTSAQRAPQQASTQQSSQQNRRPLPTNDDPAMIGHRNINRGIIASMSGSLEREVAMGRQLAAEVDRQAKFIDDPVVTEYINRVGQNIVLHSDAKVPFTIKVIDSDEVNAFALPGGFFYVNKGLILAADNEAELAGVMAHEIAHVCARHAMENQTKGQILQGAAIIGSIFLGGIPGMILNNAGGLGILAAFMKFSRSAEEEADRLGVQYLYAAGYDPRAMATMFEKLEGLNKKKPGTLAKLFADHPAPADRRASALALVERFPEREEYVISTSEFQRVKAHLLRLSNARATTAGDISNDNGTPGRPTLKRRSPSDDSQQPDSQQPSNQNPQGPPTLRRNTNGQPQQQQTPATQPSPQPQQSPQTSP